MTFRAWFEKQFGRAPLSDAKHNALQDRVVDLQRQLGNARLELSTDLQLREMWRAASYAWGCNDAYKRQGKP